MNAKVYALLTASASAVHITNRTPAFSLAQSTASTQAYETNEYSPTEVLAGQRCSDYEVYNGWSKGHTFEECTSYIQEMSEFANSGGYFAYRADYGQCLGCTNSNTALTNLIGDKQWTMYQLSTTNDAETDSDAAVDIDCANPPQKYLECIDFEYCLTAPDERCNDMAWCQPMAKCANQEYTMSQGTCKRTSDGNHDKSLRTKHGAVESIGACLALCDTDCEAVYVKYDLSYCYTLQFDPTSPYGGNGREDYECYLKNTQSNESTCYSYDALHGCVSGENIELVHGVATVEECQDLCSDYGPECLAVEYFVVMADGQTTSPSGNRVQGDCQLSSSANIAGCDYEKYSLLTWSKQEEMECAQTNTVNELEQCSGYLCSEYRGYQTKTVSGRTCQAWASQSPHAHAATGTIVADAGLDQNYCRNPWKSTTINTIGCYTTDPDVRWEFCEPLQV